MRKTYHILKENKISKFPTNYVFFDIETLPLPLNDKEIEHRFRLGVGYYCRTNKEGEIEREDWIEFKDLEKFWQWVDSKTRSKSRLVIMSHSIEFDFKGSKAFFWLKVLGYKPTKIILNGNSNIWQFRKGSKTILALDSLNYFRLNIKAIGQTLNLPKFEMPKFNEPDEVWFRYCKRDVEILAKMWFEWLKFVKENDFGSFGLTLPAQSFNAFRHKFMRDKIYIHANEEATKLEREAYHGGRTECFRIGRFSGEKFYLLDVNSMYPFVMREFDYPVKLLGFKKKGDLKLLQFLLNKFCVISEVALKVKEPIFPLKYKGRLIFPVGIFTTALTTNELKEALKMNAILGVGRIAYYQKGRIFKDFIDKLYQLRKKFKREGNKLYDWLTKLIMNSLYGKFGQQNDVFVKIGYFPELEDEVILGVEFESGKRIFERIIMGLYEKAVGKEEAFNSFPAICAEITANARLVLWHYIKKAGRENVFYCDTDSLIVNKEGFKNLKDYLDPQRLGFLKVDKVSDYLEIRNLKDYTFGDEVKIKGIRKSAQKIDDNTYLQSQFERVRGSLHKGRLNSLIEKKVLKKLKREYLKGIINERGIVEPIKLPC
jgi:hypothetical protein